MDELDLLEQKVARLRAAGCSKVAIAKELSLSIRTVENLLYAVCAKCEISSSIELAALDPM
ncbi:MAG: LuxR C-terminal-related transcriptional regulator [Candidatus Baltobacteraceae bacterium]